RRPAPWRRTVAGRRGSLCASAGGCARSLAGPTVRKRAVMSPGDHDPNAVAGGQLARRLGTFDATVIGLGSMLGAGVFAVFAPAAAAAGEGMLVALALAGVVAYCNATSSAQLATVHPTSGGTYVYGREQLGHWWGFVAGWGFVVGKTASCAAMAMTFATYVAPGFERPLALAAVVG